MRLKKNEFNFSAQDDSFDFSGIGDHLSAGRHHLVQAHAASHGHLELFERKGSPAADAPVDQPVDQTNIGAESAGALPTDSGLSSAWALGTGAASINVRTAWADYTGKGVKVGIIDDGFDYAHSDLKAVFDQNADYDARMRDASAQAETGDNHGTAVAGVIGADNNGTGAVGVAYDATLIGYRVGYGANGSSSQYVDALSRQKYVDVSNSSWGYSTPFQDNFKSGFASMGAAIEDAAHYGRGGLGTVFVFAGMNNRAAGDSVNYHDFANSPYVMAVGATTSSGVFASFSNPGDALHISAPGAGIYTTDVAGSAGWSGGDFVNVQGTSFAAPMVSGVVALMLEANPELGFRDVQEILAYSARRTDPTNADWRYNDADNWNGGGLHFNKNYGFGLMDATAAVRLAETWTEHAAWDDMAIATASSGYTTTTTETVSTKVGKGKNATWTTTEKTVTSTTDINKAIPDYNATGVSHKITLGSGIDIDTVDVDLRITHGRIGDLVVTLTGPDGTVSTLIDRPGVSSSTPGGSTLTSLSFTTGSRAFWGEDSGGDWTLTVYDKASGYTGTLNGWTITVRGDAESANDLYVYTNEFGSSPGAERSVLSDSDGGYDTINAAAVSSASTINLNAGSASTIAGRALSIEAGTSIERAFGGDGADTLIGNALANMLVGGRGADLLTGGGGADSFVFDRLADAGDRITDFLHGTDKLDLGGLFDAISYAGSNPFADGILDALFVGTSTQVYVDADGAGAQAAKLLVELLNAQLSESQLASDLLIS